MQFNNLSKQWQEIGDSVLPLINELGLRGDFINGKAVENFEAEFAEYFGSKYGVGISNGTDALKIALQLLDLSSKDLVIMPANTFIADYLAVKNLPTNQPKVALVDHDEFFMINVSDLEFFLENERQNYNKVVVMAVHLYGHCCNMEALQSLKEKFGLLIIEDCSQSHGTKYKDKFLGDVGDVSVYSLYPGKNLGAMGDAGILTTNDENLYKRAKSLRNYGSSVKYHYDELGNNHRLDTIQAIVLSAKLKRLSSWNDKKQEVADRFMSGINNPLIILPSKSQDCTYHSYHIFCIRVRKGRDSFMNFLSDASIPTIIHYPIPINKTKIFQDDIIVSCSNTEQTCDEIVSLPIHAFISDDEIELIINTINSWG